MEVNEKNEEGPTTGMGSTMHDAILPEQNVLTSEGNAKQDDTRKVEEEAAVADPKGRPLNAAMARITLTETAEVYNQNPERITPRQGKMNEKAVELGMRTDADEESRPEIQNIMDQFHGQQGASSIEEPISPSGSSLPIFQYIPRKPSLDHLSRESSHLSMHETHDSYNTLGRAEPIHTTTQDPEKASIRSHATSISVPPPPEPDPEPTLPFGFHRFLEQLRHRTADPVARYLRSFLVEFGKKQWIAREQVKVISDFLSFIANKMGQCEVWRTVSDAEFDNAREGMEKLVMNRLYTQTFSPEIVPAETPLSPKRRQKASSLPIGPGRKGQHQEDVERDEVLAQKVRIYSWIREEHLDMKPFNEKSKRFLVPAQQELIKIKSYRAPRDKVICVLNCCKILFGYLKNANSDQSADSFIPLLIHTVLKANPDHLVSNVQYILRFRNQDKLSGEAGYYMSSLLGAVQFIENLDRTNLTISNEEFEKHVEAAVSAMAEQHRPQDPISGTSPHLPFGEKSTLSRPEVMSRISTGAERAQIVRRGRSTVDTSAATDSDDGDAVAGLLRTIQKPLATIGRMFSDETITTHRTSSDRTVLKPQRVSSPGTSPGPPAHIQPSLSYMPPAADEDRRSRFQTEDAAARQASEEAAEAHSLQRAEHATVVETLSGMFPDLDKDVISDVVRMKDGRVGLAVDACLALSH